ncbi:glycosyltransferase [Aurantimonas litoralis]|nr:glycosyltransferase [Aurantimonas litoralis]
MKRQLINGLIRVFGEKRVFELALVYRRLRRMFGLATRIEAPRVPRSERNPPRPGSRPLAEALVEARSLPGSLSDAELQEIYTLGTSGADFDWIGLPEEGHQALVMALAGGAAALRSPGCQSLADSHRLIVQNGFKLSPGQRASLPTGSQLVHLAGTNVAKVRTDRFSKRLAEEVRLRVVFVNDVGFQYGAGIATRRQAQSFMRGGWDVGLICWDAGMSGSYPALANFDVAGRWLGALSLPGAHASFGMSDAEITRHVTEAVQELEPDLVLFGNIHGGNWPIDIIAAVRDQGFATAAYMHDVHWVTGRCAYPGNCDAYLGRGCDALCPTADQYPRLPRDQINPAWRRRADVFCGKKAVPLLANSDWTKDVAFARFGDAARLETLYLGLDENLFQPRSRKEARALLGLDDDRPMILLGSVNVQENRKGGPILAELLQTLARRDDLGVLAFGHNSEDLPCTRAFGGITDERMMALIYNAADIFVGTAREEAFGQTIIEANASGLPVVAFAAGGALEAMENGVTGVAVERFTAAAIMEEIDRMLADPDRMAQMGAAGRQHVLAKFTLRHQFDGARDVLGKLWPASKNAV